MLEFRAEMGLLCGLHHPNIVLFLGEQTIFLVNCYQFWQAAELTVMILLLIIFSITGICVKRPHLCIITEYVKPGSLRDLLLYSNTKLNWLQKLRILRSAAVGINYLHSIDPVIIHRDLKSSNLLVQNLIICCSLTCTITYRNI